MMKKYYNNVILVNVLNYFILRMDVFVSKVLGLLPYCPGSGVACRTTNSVL